MLSMKALIILRSSLPLLSSYQFAEYIAHCLNNLTELEAERRKWIFENVLSYVIRFLIKIVHLDYIRIRAKNWLT